ncbi:uncharacterized protein EV422DRAFT_388803 [Fimicolochytrium jonesii]|uniref:uncharacterized protein n=1 Tax=Fimicolochytrium jonesii TaxID=1396493 RepID=UPI0022FE9ECD|nr:uncharacterized protein EV422DRAFT_388803 [Fimicolochytrium jonesii]KAI8823025.1 hypothetical protein EV422DRAFT_388803 [Fimicolochytrium jonesii]
MESYDMLIAIDPNRPILPLDVMLQIFYHMCPQAVLRSERVCRSWRQIVADNDEHLWKAKLKSISADGLLPTRLPGEKWKELYKLSHTWGRPLVFSKVCRKEVPVIRNGRGIHLPSWSDESGQSSADPKNGVTHNNGSAEAQLDESGNSEYELITGFVTTRDEEHQFTLAQRRTVVRDNWIVYVRNGQLRSMRVGRSGTLSPEKLHRCAGLGVPLRVDPALRSNYFAVAGSQKTIFRNITDGRLYAVFDCTYTEEGVLCGDVYAAQSYGPDIMRSSLEVIRLSNFEHQRTRVMTQTGPDERLEETDDMAEDDENDEDDSGEDDGYDISGDGGPRWDGMPKEEGYPGKAAGSGSSAGRSNSSSHSASNGSHSHELETQSTTTRNSKPAPPSNLTTFLEGDVQHGRRVHPYARIEDIDDSLNAIMMNDHFMAYRTYSSDRIHPIVILRTSDLSTYATILLDDMEKNLVLHVLLSRMHCIVLCGTGHVVYVYELSTMKRVQSFNLFDIVGDCGNIDWVQVTPDEMGVLFGVDDGSLVWLDIRHATAVLYCRESHEENWGERGLWLVYSQRKKNADAGSAVQKGGDVEEEAMANMVACRVFDE